jgi:hypothetical protein
LWVVTSLWKLFPLICKSFLIWYHLICQFLLLYLEQLEFYSDKIVFACTIKCFPVVDSRFHLTFRSLIHFEFIFLYRMKGRDLLSVFYMWRSNIVYWRDYLFSNMFLAPLSKITWLQLWKSITVSSVLLHWSTSF